MRPIDRLGTYLMCRSNLHTITVVVIIAEIGNLKAEYVVRKSTFR